jgi:cytochrome c biogenesis protein CcmG/thiol:disulfide interchange protein DsbE
LALKAWSAALLGIGILFVGLACSSPSEPVKAAVKPGHERKQAPDFALKDADGKTVRLSDYRGKVVLLDFWATWCGPCKIEIPWFMEFERKYKDRGFAVIGVSMDEEGWEAVRPFVADRAVNYRIVIGSDETATHYGGVEALPTTFLIDRDGRIAATHVGLASKSSFQNGIEELLQAPFSGANRAGGDRARAPRRAD